MKKHLAVLEISETVEIFFTIPKFMETAKMFSQIPKFIYQNSEFV